MGAPIGSVKLEYNQSTQWIERASRLVSATETLTISKKPVREGKAGIGRNPAAKNRSRIVPCQSLMKSSLSRRSSSTIRVLASTDPYPFVSDLKLNVHVYQPSNRTVLDEFAATTGEEDDDETNVMAATVRELPSRELDGLWDTLVQYSFICFHSPTPPPLNQFRTRQADKRLPARNNSKTSD